MLLVAAQAVGMLYSPALADDQSGDDGAAAIEQGLDPVEDAFGYKIGIAGVPRSGVTLMIFEDSDDPAAELTYSVADSPDWLIQTAAGSNVFDFNPDSGDVGLHTVVVNVADAGGQSVDRTVRFDILSTAPKLAKWRLKDDTVKVAVANDSCAASSRTSGFASPVSVAVSYNGGPQDGEGIIVSSCPQIVDATLQIGAGGSDVETQIRIVSGKTEIDIEEELALGSHSYDISYSLMEYVIDTKQQTVILTTAYTNDFSFSYLLSEATVTVSDPVLLDLPFGHALATISLDGTVAGARWSVLGKPAIAVGVAGLAGMETTRGVVSLTRPTAGVDFGQEDITLTIQAFTPASESSLLQEVAELVIHRQAGILVDKSGLSLLNTSRTETTISVKLSHSPDAGEDVTLRMAVNNKRVDLNAGILVFTEDNWDDPQQLVVSLTDKGKKKGSHRANIDMNVYKPSRGAANYRHASPVRVDISINIPNQPPSFAGSSHLHTMPENPGSEVTPLGTLLTRVKASDPDNDQGQLSYSIVGDSDIFGISNTSRLSVSAATNFNYEKKKTYTITVAVEDNEAEELRGRATIEFLIALSDVNDPPVLPTPSAALTLHENVGSAQTPAGTAIGDPFVASDEDELSFPVYSLSGSPAEFAIDVVSGQLHVRSARSFDHEARSSYTVTVLAFDHNARDAVMVTVSIVNQPEPPELAALLDQTVIENVGGTYQFAAATDPDTGNSSSVTYAAMQVNAGSRLTALPSGVGFDATSRTFTFARTLAPDQTITVRVTATDGSGTKSHRDFLLRVRAGGSIVADVSSLADLSRTNSTEVIGVRLDSQPKSQAVTLTLESLAASDVAVAPVTMQFTRSNWSTAQDLTLSLTEAGVANKGIRAANVSLGVYRQSGSDEYFRGSKAQTVAVQVVNANAAPAFNVASIVTASLFLDENAGTARHAVDVNVGHPLVATDADNGDLTYSVVGRTASFKIDASSGQVQVAAGSNFNHEQTYFHRLTVQVSDGEAERDGVLPGVAVATLIVRINDVEEKPADYASHALRVLGHTRNEVTLMWSNREYMRQFEAEDRASIVVSFGADGGYRGTVAVDPDANQARVAGLVPGISYDVSLHWYSADGLAQDTAAQVAAVMTEDNAVPVLGNLVYRRHEDVGLETTAAGTAVLTVSATDDDGDEIRYSIRGGTDAARFVIDAQSGVVRLVSEMNLDHEANYGYTFKVAATDIYGASVTGDMVLYIDDVVEDPVLPVQYAQTAKQGESLTITLRAANDGRSIEYEGNLEGGEPLPDWLSLDATDGELTVATRAPEGTWQVVVRAMVSSGGSTSTGLPVAFTEPTIASERLFVLSVSPSSNSVPSFATADKVFDLPENSLLPVGYVVGGIAAVDEDDVDIVAYSLRGEDAAPFDVDSNGDLIVGEEFVFDREGKGIWKFVVDADDGRGGLASAEVEVRISDENEPPEFLAARSMYLVVASTRGSFVVPVAADPEEDSVTHTASSPGDWLNFDDSNPGFLAFTVDPDAPVGTHLVTLTATATGGRAEHELVLAVQTAGNRAPQFASVLERMRVAIVATVTVDTAIASFAATDADGDELIYRIVSGLGDDAALFTIDSASGLVEVAAGGVLAARTYRFTVEASDGNGGVSQIAVEVEVQLQQAIQDADSRQQDEIAVVVMDRALAVAAVDMLQARMSAPAAPSGGLALGQEELGNEPPYMRMASATDQWSSWRSGHESGSDRIERMQWREFIYSRGFDLALDDAGSRGPRTRLWGSGSRSMLDGDPVEDAARVAYDGSAKLFMIGVEAGLSRTRFGVAVGSSDAKLSLGSAAEARVERDLKFVYPYLSFRLSDRVWAWAAGGYGSGDYVRMETGARTARDAAYTSFAGGIKSSWGDAPAEFSVGVKAVAASSRLAAGGAAQPAVKGSSWRGEADFRAARRFDLRPDIWLRPFVGVHLHHDGGDDWLDVNSLDTTAGMSVAWSGGLRLEFKSRWQVNEGDVNEERLEASIDYDYGSDGRGLMLSASPSVSGSADAPLSRSLGARVGYGLPVRLLSDSGIATVSADLSDTEESLGSRYGLSFAGRRLDVDLSAAGDGYRLGLRIR